MPRRIVCAVPRSMNERKDARNAPAGSYDRGLQTKAGDALTAKGWDVIATANSSSTSIKVTTVYYSNAADQDVAEGIELALGAKNIGFTNEYPGSSITVVVGADYKG